MLRGLKDLVRRNSAVDERLRRACLLVRETRAFAWLGFRSFTVWCSEGLGISPRTVRHHVEVERKLQALPPLREAVRNHVLTLEQARQVGRHATLEDVAARIEAATRTPVITTRREADAEEERQMWDVSKLHVSMPERVHELFREALLAGQHHFPGLDPGQLVVCIAAHFLLTWREEVERILKSTDKVILRDRWLCQVPGCSRAAEHLHHLWFRSHGGPDARWNLISLCIPHHLFGVHQGYLEITGRAPDALTFVIGEEAVLQAKSMRYGLTRSEAA